MSDCAGTWWNSFLCILTSPATAVDLVVVAISAGVAAAIAVVVLRRQLRHDREILDEQMKHEQAITRASLRRPYIEQLANALIDFGTATGSLRTSEIGSELWNGKDAPGSKELFTTWLRLESFVQFEDSAVVDDIWRDVMHRWNWSAKWTRELIADDTTERTLAAAGTAADSVYTPAHARAVGVGAALLKWDGVAPLDLSGPLSGWTPADWERDEIKAAAEKEFLRVLTKYLHRGSPQEARILERVKGAREEASI
ncbi:hypothetical protein [Agromyces ramosus]|uniref:DUF4760 domain-containing protein n=1 Tax=Agromyces ramosus TaxID=33879 RepID=A0ABU0RCI6_9MICO|nr:hypothetical protein [Agromyces ramosus]MDQ0895784.1 hypothetical protein [Agromyces ramosus]